LLIGPKGIY
jgi:rRNA processing protein Krr1/Pno1